MREPVLITGAGGFIGANLIGRLLKDSYPVHALLKPSTDLWRIRDVESKIHRHSILLQDGKGIQKVVRLIKPAIIFHLAAHGAYATQNNLDEMIATNIIGTANLLQALESVPYRIFVHVGSSSEYGLKALPMRETDMLDPMSYYAATKASATLLGQVMARSSRKPIVTVRPFSVYGPYEEPSRFIPTIIRAVKNKEAIRLTPGQTRHDFVFVGDVIDACMKTITKREKLSGEILNIGTGIQHTNERVVQALFRVTKLSVPIHKGQYPARSWDTPYWVADTIHTQHALGWKATTTLSQGLLATYRWHEQQSHRA